MGGGILTWKVLLKVLLGMVELIFLIWRRRGVRAFLGVLLVSLIGLGLTMTLSSLLSFFFLFLIICSTDPSIRSVSFSFTCSFFPSSASFIKAISLTIRICSISRSTSLSMPDIFDFFPEALT